MRTWFIFFALIGAPHASAMTTGQSIEFYQSRYPLDTVYDKLVDDNGDGFSPLYGVRNFRAVLNGVVYRGGANNSHNIHGPRPTMNPLPAEGLLHLCQEGFGTAIYLYPTNYATAQKITSCDSIFGERAKLNYDDDLPLQHLLDAREILSLIHKRLISTTDNSPIYLHCWNGWHASGYISALVLRQFCGLSGDKAVDYWNANTDGNNGSSFEPIRKKIRQFVPYEDLQIDPELRSGICPSGSEF